MMRFQIDQFNSYKPVDVTVARTYLSELYVSQGNHQAAAKELKRAVVVWESEKEREKNDTMVWLARTRVKYAEVGGRNAI